MLSEVKNEFDLVSFHGHLEQPPLNSSRSLPVIYFPNDFIRGTNPREICHLFHRLIVFSLCQSCACVRYQRHEETLVCAVTHSTLDTVVREDAGQYYLTNTCKHTIRHLAEWINILNVCLRMENVGKRQEHEMSNSRPIPLTV